MSFYTKRPPGAASFRIVSYSMLRSVAWLLSHAIDEELFKMAPLSASGLVFAYHEDAVYAPSSVLWALVFQALFEDEHRIFTAAVSRIASCGLLKDPYGTIPKQAVTHEYFTKSRINGLLGRVRQIAQRAESSPDLLDPIQDEKADSVVMPTARAALRRQSIRGRVLLIDGFTLDAADTQDNQEVYPQSPSQKDGLGFPIHRCLALS